MQAKLLKIFLVGTWQRATPLYLNEPKANEEGKKKNLFVALKILYNGALGEKIAKGFKKGKNFYKNGLTA